MVVVLGKVVQALTALLAQARAVRAAQGAERQVQDQGITQRRLQVQARLPHEEEVLRLLVPFLLLGRSGLGQEVELVKGHGAVLVQVAQAAHALTVDVDVCLPAHEHAVVHGGQ